MTTPIGIRQHNPGNLEIGKKPWDGQLPPVNGDRFCRFSSPLMGIRALSLNTRNMYRRRGVKTIQGLIERHAPSNENNVAAYVASVAKRSGLPPDVPINLNSAEALERIIPAMIHHENGCQPYPPELIAEAVKLAMGAK